MREGGVPRSYVLLVAGVLLALLALFAIAELLHVPWLTDAGARMHEARAATAIAGVTLLVADVLLPVPSSIVMTAHGALFGVAIGTLLSLAGSVGAAVAGYAIGRCGGPLLARRVPADERARADRLLARWGLVAVIASRPVPLLAETVAIAAGASAIGAGRVAVAALAGCAPAAALYALAGDRAGGFTATLLVFCGALVLAAAALLAGRRLGA
jgi:uncharacterized membrane protein YdjX (TVP38/TMEM64 family)